MQETAPMPTPNDPPDQPLPPPRPTAERGVAPDAPAISVNTVQSGGGAVAVGGNVYDQRTFHLPAAPPAAPAFVVPYPRNPLFTGRDAELARIGNLLDAEQSVAVVGTGGLGKTQLVTEYAHAARDRYPGGVFWLNMEQAEGIAGQVAALAGPGGLNLPQAPALDFAGKVAAVRAAWTEPVVRLLIFDNLEDPKVWQEWQPSGGGARVLITSRRQTWAATSGVEVLQLPPLSRRASQELLLAARAKIRKTTAAALLADPTVAADADAICEALGDLPLALALVAAYLETTPSATLARYRADIEATPLARLETELEDALPTGHEASILKTFALSYDKLGATQPDDALARTLLHRVALLAPAPIPRRLLVRVASLDPDDAYAQEQADHALRRLAALGLIEDLGDDGARLHRLLAAYVRHRADDGAENNRAVAEALIAEVRVIRQIGYTLSAGPYLEHLRRAIAQAGSQEDSLVGRLYNNLGYLLHQQGDWDGAREALERALMIRRAIRGPMHPGIAPIFNLLGMVLQSQGEQAAARRHFEQALAICEHTSACQSRDVVHIRNNLAFLRQQEGDWLGARQMYEAVLQQCLDTFGVDDAETAQTLNNLGYLLRGQGELQAARQKHEQALAIRVRVLNPMHSGIATSHNNLALVLQDLGELAGARLHLEQALAIYEQALGPYHPNTAKVLYNLGLLLQELGDAGAARPLLERAWMIRMQTLGADHRATQQVSSHLSQVRQVSDAGKTTE
jgi:tetratricopeptide (TPR) repeat protein